MRTSLIMVCTSGAGSISISHSDTTSAFRQFLCLDSGMDFLIVFQVFQTNSVAWRQSHMILELSDGQLAFRSISGERLDQSSDQVTALSAERRRNVESALSRNSESYYNSGHRSTGNRGGSTVACRLSGRRAFVHAGPSLSRREQLMLRLESSGHSSWATETVTRNAISFSLSSCCTRAFQSNSVEWRQTAYGEDADRQHMMKIIVTCREEFGTYSTVQDLNRLSMTLRTLSSGPGSDWTGNQIMSELWV